MIGPQRIGSRTTENEAPLEAGMMVTDGESQASYFHQGYSANISYENFASSHYQKRSECIVIK